MHVPFTSLLAREIILSVYISSSQAIVIMAISPASATVAVLKSVESPTATERRPVHFGVYPQTRLQTTCLHAMTQISHQPNMPTLPLHMVSHPLSLSIHAHPFAAAATMPADTRGSALVAATHAPTSDAMVCVTPLQIKNNVTGPHGSEATTRIGHSSSNTNHDDRVFIKHNWESITAPIEVHWAAGSPSAFVDHFCKSKGLPDDSCLSETERFWKGRGVAAAIQYRLVCGLRAAAMASVAEKRRRRTPEQKNNRRAANNKLSSYCCKIREAVLDHGITKSLHLADMTGLVSICAMRSGSAPVAVDIGGGVDVSADVNEVGVGTALWGSDAFWGGPSCGDGSRAMEHCALSPVPDRPEHAHTREILRRQRRKISLLKRRVNARRRAMERETATLNCTMCPCAMWSPAAAPATTELCAAECRQGADCSGVCPTTTQSVAQAELLDKNVISAFEIEATMPVAPQHGTPRPLAVWNVPGIEIEDGEDALWRTWLQADVAGSDCVHRGSMEMEATDNLV